MTEDELESRLSQIETTWTLVEQAHASSTETAPAARRELMRRYLGAAYRYLFAAVRDPDVADELFQEFALRFTRGDFHRADPGRGKFRQYIKTALVNLIRSQRQQKWRHSAVLKELQTDPAIGMADFCQLEKPFVESWRQELLARAWRSLQSYETDQGRPYYSVLRHRVATPRASICELSAAVSAALGRDKVWTDTGMRKLLQRSREMFAELLLDEVSCSLESPSFERLEEELIELDLLEYCRPVLAARRRQHDS